jgi:glutamate 5-kinase
MGNPVHDRRMIRSAQRWVVKIGSSLVTDEGRGIDPQAIARWAAQIAALRGHETPWMDLAPP